jgi:pre-mRNA-splicing helicase BRR2
MSNDKCHLPPGSYKISKKGYEEITIPASKHKSSKDKPVLIGELPSWAQPAFSGFKELNVIQSAVCDAAMNTSDNLLICAPTGAGKTNVALLTMLQVIG